MSKEKYDTRFNIIGFLTKRDKAGIKRYMAYGILSVSWRIWWYVKKYLYFINYINDRNSLMKLWSQIGIINGAFSYLISVIYCLEHIV